MQDPLTLAVASALVLLVLVRALDVWEREPLGLLLALFLWGALGAGGIAAAGNQAVEAALSEDVALVYGAAISAPLVEEIAKGVALLAAVLASGWTARRFRTREFSGPTDGMVYGVAVGLGFAFSENYVYFLNDTFTSESLAAGFATLDAREGFLNLATLGHGVYTGLFGLGLGLATWSADRLSRIAWPLIGLGAGMFLHAVNNGMVELIASARYGFDTVAEIYRTEQLPPDIADQFTATYNAVVTVLLLWRYALAALFFLALLLWVRQQGRILARELAEEAITPAEARTASQYGARLVAYARLARAGRWSELRALRHLHAVLAELAFEKWRVRRGQPAGDLVALRRRELAAARTAH
jgi:protease PrsW